MSDFSPRNIPGLGLLQAELERTTGKLNDKISSAEAYSPGDATLWLDPPPTTVAEAIDRLVAALKAEHPGRDI